MSSFEFAEHEEYQEHVVPYTVYLAVFGALMVLTLMTVAVAFYDLGNLNVAGRADRRGDQGHARRAVLHAREVRLAITKLVVISSIVWLGFLFFITLSDYLTRGWLMAPPIDPPGQGLKAEG